MGCTILEGNFDNYTSCQLRILQWSLLRKLLVAIFLLLSFQQHLQLLMHFDSDHDSHQLNLCCAKNNIGVFQLLRDHAVDLFKMYNDQNQNARGVANVAENESIRKMATKAFLKRDHWRILSWHDIYLSKFPSKMVHPIANFRVINRCNEMRTYCSHFGCWYKHT